MTSPKTSPKTSTPRKLFGIALRSGGRGIALTGATALLIVHALAEATIPVIIGATIDRAVLPADPAALALWLGVLVGTFLVLTVSYQSASRLMVSVYGYGEQALRHLALSRMLRPRLSRRTVTSSPMLMRPSAANHADIPASAVVATAARVPLTASYEARERPAAVAARREASLAET